MKGVTGANRRLALRAAAAGLALTVWLGPAAPAEARVVVGIGVPLVFGPEPYYPPPPPPYYPPPAYYPAPPPAYYPPPPPVYYAPPPPPPVYYSPAPATDPGAPYRTDTCREYQSTTQINGRPQQVYGTACRQPDGSWRVVE